MTSAAERPRGGKTAAQVLDMLLRFEQPGTGIAQVGHHVVADLAGLAPRAVRRALRQLQRDDRIRLIRSLRPRRYRKYGGFYEVRTDAEVVAAHSGLQQRLELRQKIDRLKGSSRIARNRAARLGAAAQLHHLAVERTAADVLM